MKMKLVEQIKNDVRRAIKQGKRQQAEILRYLLSLLEKEEIRLGEKFNQEAALRVLQKEMKQKEEALAVFRQANRQDLIKEQEEEIKVLSQYLPQMMSRKEIRALAERVIKKEGISDFGKVMGKIMPLVQGKAEGKLVAEVVRELLI